MNSIFVFITVAAGLGLIVLVARSGRTRISLRGEESTLPDNDGDASGALLTCVLDGPSHQGTFHGDMSHHGACDSGGHSGSYDCGSHAGFDGGSHH